ncbi:TetR/AcrR family transcriptional regulator [Streptomyces xiamenensis]|uniref:TetR/AcrR family transcriptional regulator n=1 Tax=Streptomyces xiamenensis TaxID=408015 RepID=UPI0037D70363
MRADARRNYERLLTEAESAFLEHGVQAPLDTVARRAGVAIGTLYGHFPTRRALLKALLHDRQAALLRLGDKLTEAPDPGVALTAWIRAATEYSATYLGLAEQSLDSLTDTSSELHAGCTHNAATGATLVTRAQQAGAVRPDVTPEDVFALISAAAWLHGRVPREQADRLLAVSLAGLAPRADDRR